MATNATDLRGRMADTDNDTSANRGARTPSAAASAKEDASKTVRYVWLGLVLLLTVCGFTAGLLADSGDGSNAGFADATAVIVLVTAIAAGVERIIEVIWNTVDRKSGAGGWWPLSEVVGTLKLVEKSTNELLGPPLADVKSLLDQGKDLADDGSDITDRARDAAERINERLEATKNAIENAQVLAPGSARFAALARAGDDFTRDALLIAREAQIQSDKLEKALADVADGLAEATDIVAGFSDNPARRSMSIALGVSIAMLVAGYLQLNLFVAILGAETPGDLIGWKGVLATGIVMGLGTNPTHEVIKALQRRKGDTTEEVPVATVVPGSVGATRSDRFSPVHMLVDTDGDDSRAGGPMFIRAALGAHDNWAGASTAPTLMVRRTQRIRRTS